MPTDIEIIWLFWSVRVLILHCFRILELVELFLSGTDISSVRYVFTGRDDHLEQIKL